MDKTKEIAYLRELVASNQCELTFSLKLEIQGVGLLQEEVRAVRQITDTVGSLMQHIVNKIKKSIVILKEKYAIDDKNEVEIRVTLQNGQKTIKPHMILKNLITANMKNIVFLISNQSYSVVINAPLVKELKLPAILYSNFTVQASRLHVLFAENNKCQFTWYKSRDKNNWTKIAETYRYKVVEDDIGCYLKLVCVPFNKIVKGPPSEVISENPVEQIGDLPKCPFEERHKFTMERLTDNNFRVVSYNVLSNRYTEANEPFPYCSPKALATDYRKQLITKELLGYQADIICLQEVDSSLYISYYKDLFKDKGYMSYYHRKGNRISEGLACFFSKHRFKKVSDGQILYNNEIKNNRLFTYLWNLLRANTDLKECFMKQMTSLQITILKVKTEKNHYVIVANTHLFYHPEAELIRILQVNIATTYLSTLARIYKNDGSKVCVIFCGDFNCVPSSAVYDYLINGRLSKNHNIFEKVINKCDLFHKFQFQSACGLPKYTNYTDNFKDCLDYIFVEKNAAKVNQVVPFPSEEQLSVYEGLPNEVFPSDHLALVVDLQLF